MNEFITDGVQDQHFVLAFANFTSVVILKLPAPAARLDETGILDEAGRATDNRN